MWPVDLLRAFVGLHPLRAAGGNSFIVRTTCCVWFLDVGVIFAAGSLFLVAHWVAKRIPIHLRTSEWP